MSKLDHLSSNHVTSSSLGSRLNYNYTSHSTPPNRRSPSPYQSSIIQITREDGRVERRLETCSYQETEMVSDIYVHTNHGKRFFPLKHGVNISFFVKLSS